MPGMETQKARNMFIQSIHIQIWGWNRNSGGVDVYVYFRMTYGFELLEDVHGGAWWQW